METRSLLLPPKTPRYHFWTVSGNATQSPAIAADPRSPCEGQVSFNTGKMDNSHLPLFSTIEAMTKIAKIRHFIFFFSWLVFALLQRGKCWLEAFEISSGTHFNKIHWKHFSRGNSSYYFFGGRWLGEYRARSVQCHVHGSMIDRALIAAAFKWSLSLVAVAGNFCQVGLDSVLDARPAQLRCEWVSSPGRCGGGSSLCVTHRVQQSKLEGAGRFQLKFAKLTTTDERTDERVNGDASRELNYEEDLRSLALWLLLCLSFWFVAFQLVLVLDGKEGSLYAYTRDRDSDGRKVFWAVDQSIRDWGFLRRSRWFYKDIWKLAIRVVGTMLHHMGKKQQAKEKSLWI